MDVFSAHSPINFGFPSLKLFSLPPSQPYKSIPRPPPSVPSHVLANSLFQRIRIDPDLFYTSLDIKFVLTFTAIYVTTVLYLNQFNASRQYQPWRFTKTSAFKALVVAHNALLALFSAWTFCSLFTILLPLWDVAVANAGPNYYAHVAELLCETDSNAYRGRVSIIKLIIIYEIEYNKPSDKESPSPANLQKSLGSGRQLHRLALLYEQVLRSHRYPDHSCAREKKLYITNLSPCRGNHMWMGNSTI